MAIEVDDTVADAILDAVESAIGYSPKVRFYNGTIPANCSLPPDGVLLAETVCPSDFMANATGRSKTKLAWSDGIVITSGDVHYFRVYESTGTFCRMQGTVTVTGGGGDMTIDDITLVATESVRFDSFTLNF